MSKWTPMRLKLVLLETIHPKVYENIKITNLGHQEIRWLKLDFTAKCNLTRQHGVFWCLGLFLIFGFSLKILNFEGWLWDLHHCPLVEKNLSSNSPSTCWQKANKGELGWTRINSSIKLGLKFAFVSLASAMWNLSGCSGNEKMNERMRGGFGFCFGGVNWPSLGPEHERSWMGVNGMGLMGTRIKVNPLPCSEIVKVFSCPSWTPF